MLNVSRGGVCIEASSRLLPGTPVDVQLIVFEWRWNGQATVLGCYVSALAREATARYTAGLQLKNPIDAEVLGHGGSGVSRARVETAQWVVRKHVLWALTTRYVGRAENGGGNHRHF